MCVKVPITDANSVCHVNTYFALSACPVPASWSFRPGRLGRDPGDVQELLRLVVLVRLVKAVTILKNDSAVAAPEQYLHVAWLSNKEENKVERETAGKDTIKTLSRSCSM